MHEHDDIQVEPDADMEHNSHSPDLAEEEERTGAKIKKVKEELASVRKERQEYLDGWQRAKADYVNALKRFETDLARARETGVREALEAFLPALDALARAREHGDMPEGYRAIDKQFESALASLGLTAIGAPGEAFNTAMHEALGQDAVEKPEEDDTVTAVLEKGWLLGKTLLRPAKVRIGHYEKTAA